MVTGTGVNICDGCHTLCGEILKEEYDHLEKIRLKKLPTPREITAHLDQYVVGQKEAKRALSVAVYNHYKRISPFILKDEAVEIAKSNVLLLGPTGTGKTFLAQTLARIMDVPFAIVDATSLTEAGYIGEDVESILLRLIQNADGDVEAAQRGIIYIDEIDKLARRQDSASLTRDVSGEGVQQGLLKILEGTTASVQPNNGRKHPKQEFIQIDTSNILFIASGAFSGLEEVVEERLNKTSVGFGAPIKKAKSIGTHIFKQLETEDLHKYGMIPEFIGRLPIISFVNALSVDDLAHILTEPKNAIIKQYKQLFNYDNVTLRFEPEAIKSIVELAHKRGNGARGLRSIVERILEPIMYEIPSNNDITDVIITDECVAALENPELEVEPKIIYKLPEKQKSTLLTALTGTI
jgi:ATP-dependent Clp protease ATP-binding subunit ClpX